MRLILDLVHVKDHPIYERTYKNWYYLRARREGDDPKSPFVFMLPVGGDYKSNPIDGFSFIAQVTRWLVQNEDPEPRLMPLEAIPECAWEDYMDPKIDTYGWGSETESPETVRKPETVEKVVAPEWKCPGCGTKMGTYHQAYCPILQERLKRWAGEVDPDVGPGEAQPDTEGGSDEPPSTESSRP
jgi:hypothetical protein